MKVACSSQTLGPKRTNERETVLQYGSNPRDIPVRKEGSSCMRLLKRWGSTKDRELPGRLSNHQLVKNSFAPWSQYTQQDIWQNNSTDNKEKRRECIERIIAIHGKHLNEIQDDQEGDGQNNSASERSWA
jgi:hypothetical protein